MFGCIVERGCCWCFNKKNVSLHGLLRSIFVKHSFFYDKLMFIDTYILPKMKKSHSLNMLKDTIYM